MNAEVGFPQTTNFSTSDGFELEAEFLLPKKIKAIAVLSHPHPLYGGEMHNNVIQSLFESLPESSIGTLRYNFRGAGLSEGTHGKGKLETLDVEAAFTYAGSLGGSIPIISVGYSFGADVSLSTDHSNLAGWVGIAAPLSLLEPQQMPAGHDKRPTLLLVPQHDQYRSPDEAAATSHSWVSTSLSIIDGGDHFLMGRSKPVTEATAAFVKTIIDS
tara:strand:+ start:6798 stop:7442 length:645 start_codon:yes stop_codon:yes gene_type:complete